MTLKHLIFQIVQYTECHCIRVQEIPASMSTSTKTIHFSFQFYTIVIQNRNFNFGSIKIHQLVSTNRESDWKLVKFQYYPSTSRPVIFYFSECETISEISIKASKFTAPRAFSINKQCVPYIYRQLH